MTPQESTSVESRPAGRPTQTGSSLHEAFQAQAHKTPDAIAVCSEATSLTYEQLDRRSNLLAWHLKDLGVGAEVPVALYLDREPEAVVAILAVLKAGGCYVPMDPAYPRERLAFMLEDTNAPVVLTCGSLAGSLPTSGIEVVELETVLAAESLANVADLPSETSEEDAAYIIYTSGSTGNPKGVVVTHQNVGRLFEQTASWFGFHSEDVWTWFHSYAFDVSVWELWGALLHGGRLVMVPYAVSRSPEDFYRLLVREQVTVLNQTPSAFRQLIWAEGTAASAGPLCLRYVICAGEALELQSLKPWFDRHGDQHPLVVNMYGITETTVHSTYRPIRKSDLARGARSPIGVPIPDLQIHLLDNQLRPVAQGEPGEIWVGGAGVARGYLNRPELTQAKFVPDPFSLRPGARLYRSGDLARRTEDGEFEYLGRIDDQVKIRGFRIELGEIESVLNRHPDVRESVVLAREAGAEGRRLVAYVVPLTEAPTVSALRDFLGRKLPDYMVPAQFVFLTSLPLTTNGKVDRRALPEPGGARPALTNDLMAPRDDAERVLAAIWQEVLGIERVGVDDNFFELGGDSLLSIVILSRARQRGLRVSVEQMLRCPTVAGMAACADTSAQSTEQRREDPFSLISPDDLRKLPADAVDAYPVSRLQLGMFFQNEWSPASAIYHDVFSFRIQAVFDRRRLAAALERLIARHAVLRTSFDLVSFSEPMQLVHREAPLSFGTEDLRALTPEAQDAELVHWIDREKRIAFDRTRPPLIRFHVHWLKDGEFQLVVSFHHACLDGWSLAAIVTEVLQDYTAPTRSSDSAIQRPRVAYREFVRLEREAAANARARDFWKNKLQEPSVCRLPRWTLPADAGGAQPRSAPDAVFLEQTRGPEREIDGQVFAGLKRLANRARVPLKTVLLAAHQRVMSLLYGHADAISGVLGNGRPEEIDGERVIGLFLNTVPFRLHLKGGRWLDLVAETFAAEQELTPHRRYPLAEIHKLNGGRPLFETAFDFVHFHVYNQLKACNGLGFAEGRYFEANDLTTYTTFALDAASTRLELHIDYDSNAICRQQIEQMTDYYLRTLEAMATDPEGRYDLFSPMSEPERRQILVEWNRTAEEYPADRSVPELFEERVRETPEAVALAFGNERLTYRELDCRANRLARRLAEMNVGPEVLVGICLERSVQMVTSLLGVWKAGGAYVPFDPAGPGQRLAFMLEEANVRVLVTQSRLAKQLPRTEAHVICLDDDEQLQAGEAEPHTGRPKASPTDLAYVIYTSGSTGKPKAVQIIHRALVNVLTSVSRLIGLTPEDHLLAITTLSFDIAALELFSPLIAGARVTLADGETAADPTALAALLASCGATMMQATPTAWRLLIESGWTGCRTLKILCGGEALPRSLADQLLARAHQVWNVYGPTETTVWSTAWRVLPGEPISIGRPLANTQLFILDESRQPVPVGVTGELCIGGDGLARGYLNQPELTAEKFIANPFSQHADSRLYRTGDLARYRPDGLVECQGRIDDQVKIRGHRIELGEVEGALRQHPGIAEAVAAAHMNPNGEQQLVAYLVNRNGPIGVSELRDFIRSKLPAYMVPARFVPLKEIPRTPNGKTDRRRLPQPEIDANLSAKQVAPRDETERALAGLWQEMLGCGAVGVEDDFFELGGDSLSATRLFARVNQRFGTGITLRDVFEHPTIAALALLLRNPPAPDPPRHPIKRRQRRLIIWRKSE